RLGPALLPEGSHSPYAPVTALAGGLLVGGIVAVSFEGGAFSIPRSLLGRGGGAPSGGDNRAPGGGGAARPPARGPALRVWGGGANRAGRQGAGAGGATLGHPARAERPVPAVERADQRVAPDRPAGGGHRAEPERRGAGFEDRR